MAVLLQLLDAHKSYGDQVLLDGAEVTLTDAHKVGFIGRNGAGKSTLCRVLLGDEELDKGEVVRHPQAAAGLSAAARSVSAGRDGARVPDARQRPARLAVRRSGRPVRAQGPRTSKARSKSSPAAGRRASSWRPCCCTIRTCCCSTSRRTFSTCGRRFCWSTFCATFAQACLIVSHDRAFLGATCTQTLELSRGKLTLFPGPIDAFLEYQRERREHDERVNAAILAKRRQLETFIDKNRARASTASRARSKGKQLERLQTIEIAGAEADGQHSRAGRRAAQGPARALRRPGDRLSRPRSGPRHRRRDRARHARGHRRRQRPGQDDVSAHGRLVARTAGRTGPLGLRLRDRHLCPARLHRACPRSGPCSSTWNTRPRRARRRRPFWIWPAASCFAATTCKKPISVLSGGERARLCLAGLLLEPVQRAGARRAGQPPGRRHGRCAGRSADRLPGHGAVHQPRPALHEARGHRVVEVRDGRVVNYRGDYDAYLVLRQQGNRRRRARADAKLASRQRPGRPPRASDRKAARPAAARTAQGSRGTRAHDRPARRAQARAQRANCSKRPIRPKPCGCTRS